MAVIEGKTYVTCGCAGTGRVNSYLFAYLTRDFDGYFFAFFATSSTNSVTALKKSGELTKLE